MADLDYTVGVNTTPAERSLANLQKSVGNLNDTFIRLKSTLATISLGAIITQAVRFADSVQDLADATDLTTASIIGFGQAVAQNGGTVDGAQKGIAKLIGEIDDAANSAGATREAFKEVGVSLVDLRTKSTQDIFKQVITGLGGIDDSATKSRLATILLNKEMRGVNFKGVGADFGGSTASAAQYANATKAAAEANDKLAAAVAVFQLKLVAALEPINKFIASIEPKTIEIFADRLINIGTALAGLFIIGKVATMIESFILLTRGASAATLSMAASAGGAASIFPMFALGLKQIGEAFDLNKTRIVASYTGFGVFGLTLKSLATGFLRMIPLIGTAIVALQVLDGVVESLTGKNLSGWLDNIAASTESFVASNFPKLAAALNSLGKSLGMAPPPSEVAAAEKAAKDRLANLKEEQAEVDAVRKKQADLVRGQAAAAKFAADIAKQAAAYRSVNAAQTRVTQSLFDNLGFQRDTIGLTENELEVRTKVKEETDRYADAIQNLKDKQASLKAEMIGEKDAEKVKLLGNEIALINVTLKQGEGLHKLNKQQIEEQIPVIQGLRMVEAARKQDIENTNKAIEDQISRQQQLGDILRGINDQRVDLQKRAELTKIDPRDFKSPLERQIAEIKESARKAALEAARTYAAAFEDTGDGLTTERAAELARGLNAIADGYIGIANSQIEALASTQGFVAGLTSAWDEYKTKALDTAGQVKDSFSNFTQGMEDAFVKFAQTGKLSFKDLANSIIADLAKIAFKKAVVGMASLFGFAAGGQVMGDTPIIVGERGPELFVPRSAGAIVPNNALGGMANRSNEGGGQTAVTYNIQAVDAASFRSLVARDPSFIYAVTEQGRRSQPSRSR